MTDINLPEVLTVVGPVTWDVPTGYDGFTVSSIEGGTVTRGGVNLGPGDTLDSSDVLTFTPGTQGGTVSINGSMAATVPDGGADGADGRGIASITVSGSNLTGTYTDGTSWDAGPLPVGSSTGLSAPGLATSSGAMGWLNTTSTYHGDQNPMSAPYYLLFNAPGPFNRVMIGMRSSGATQDVQLEVYAFDAYGDSSLGPLIQRSRPLTIPAGFDGDAYFTFPDIIQLTTSPTQCYLLIKDAGGGNRIPYVMGSTDPPAFTGMTNPSSYDLNLASLLYVPTPWMRLDVYTLTLDPKAFPTATSTADIPEGGTARVGNALYYRDSSGVVQIGGSGGGGTTTINPQPYSSGSTYAANDWVTANRSLYQAVQAVPAGQPPAVEASNAYWKLVVQGGQDGATGATGPQGDTGPAGANGTGFTPRGAWASDTAYAVNDIVTTGGQTYRVSTAHTAGGSFDLSKFELWAAKGADGTGSGGGTTNLPTPGPAGDVLTSDGSGWVSSAPTSTGGGSVTSVNSKTGVVELNASDVGAAPAAHATNTSNPHGVTKAQVGLGNVTDDAQVKRSEMGQPSGVATLGADGKVPASQLPASTGGTLDAEAVQDIVGAMLGEVQGHYDDAAGTYTINLPAGGTVTEEQVQDIVGAMARSGANVTVAYDDAAGTLTVSSTGGGGATGGYSSSNLVPLATLGTPNFLPADRVASDAGNYRAVGPAFTAPIGTDLTYSQVRVPLRNTQAGSANVGKTVVLLQVNIANKSVVKRVTGVVQAGQTEMILAGPFVVPQGQQHGFIVGVLEGSWDAHLSLFYGAGAAFTAPNASQPVAFSDDVLSATVGSAYNVAGVNTARHRTVLLDGQNSPKGTVGPAFTVGATRPATPAVGDQHFDTALHKPLWYDGGWRDAAGTLV